MKTPQREKSVVSEPYQRIKKAPIRGSPRVNDIYVLAKKTTIHTYVKRAQKLINQQLVPVIHGLGKSISKAATVATVLQELYVNTLDLSIETSTERLVDELDYENEDLDPGMETRNVSAIHITVKPKSSVFNLAKSLVLPGS